MEGGRLAGSLIWRCAKSASRKRRPLCRIEVRMGDANISAFVAENDLNDET